MRLPTVVLEPLAVPEPIRRKDDNMNWNAFRNAINVACSLFLDGKRDFYVQNYEVGDVKVKCTIELVERAKVEIADWSKPAFTTN